jgi:thaumarchaeosortase
MSYQRIRSFFAAAKQAKFLILLLILILMPIILVFMLDLYNMEPFQVLNDTFVFEQTWKGRMFYLIFAWLIGLELFLNWKEITKRTMAPHSIKSKVRTIAGYVSAMIPTVYVVGVNFFGLNQAVLALAQYFKIEDNLWPLSVEYMVLFASFAIAVFLVSGSVGLQNLSLPFAILGGMGIAYSVDSVYPRGILEPAEALAIPTAASAVSLLDLLGYNVHLLFTSGEGAMPTIVITSPVRTPALGVAWPCAGVHSLFLYTVIILLFFQRSGMSLPKKIAYFIVGAIGTFMANVLRIMTISLMALQDALARRADLPATRAFHDSYGEFFFFSWLLIFLLLIVAIESGKVRGAYNKVVGFFKSLRQSKEKNVKLTPEPSS